MFRKSRQEKGSADLITTLMILPLAFFLIIGMIDISLYFQSRTTAQNMARDAVRQVAMWGGTETRLSPYNVESTLESSLYSVSGQMRTTSRPAASCGIGSIPSTPPSINTTTRVQANDAGQNAYCIVSYKYTPISTSIIPGFNEILSNQVTIVEQGKTETGFR